MRKLTNRTGNALVEIVGSVLMFASVAAQAADGSWNVDADGNWSATANWLGNTVAEGVGSTAYFTNDVSLSRTVTLDLAQTVGNLVFSDGNTASSPEAGWILAGATLTLSNSAATPVINVRDLINADGLNDAKITAPLNSGQGFVKRGPNTLNLTVANSFGAPVRLDEGLVAVGNSAALGAGNSEVIFNGGGVRMVAGVTYANTNNLLTTGTVYNTSGNYDSFNGYVKGTGTLYIYTSSRLTMGNGAAGAFAGFTGTLSVGNSPNGLTRINLGSGAVYDFSAITLDLGTNAGRFAPRMTKAGGVWRIGALKGEGTTPQLQSSEQSSGVPIYWEIGSLNTDSVFAGRLTPYGSGRVGSLVKVGTGKLTLSNPSHTYTGGTTISNGTLALIGSCSIATSPSITVVTPGRFDVSGMDSTWTLAAAQTLAGVGVVTGNVSAVQGTIAPGIGAVGTLSFSNNLSLAGSLALTNLFEVGSAGNDKILVAGDLTVSETVIVRVVPTGTIIPNGTYTLMKCGGTLSAGLNSLILEYPAQTGTLTLGVNTGTKEIYLTVSGVASATDLTWMGDLSANWDLVTANWRNGGVSSLFTTGDNVTFDNTSSATSVNLAIDASPGAVVVNATKNYVFDNGGGSGKITGTTSLVKSNTGTLTLATDNDYTGATRILGGTVVIGDGVNGRGKFGTGPITNNATVAYNRPDDLTITETFYGTGNLVKMSWNTLTVRGVNYYSGSTVLSNGVVIIPDATSLQALGTSTLMMAGGQLTVWPAGASESGLPNPINVVENSTLEFTSSGTYACVLTGPLTGTSGKALTVNSTSSSAQNRLRLYSAFTNNADLVLNSANIYMAPYNSTGRQVYNGLISGAGIIINRANGGQTIFNNAGNTYSGGMMLSLGGVGVGADSVSSGGTLVSGPLGTGPITLAVESGTTPASGSCALFASGGPRRIENPITYQTGTNVETFILSGSNNLTLSGAMSLNGNDGTITNRTIQVDNTALSTLSGVISDGGLAGTLIKTGNGVLVLAGTSTYTGLTTVSAGTLLVNGQIDIGGVAVASAGTLGGTGTIVGPVTADAGSTLSPGVSVGTLTLKNNLTLSGNLLVEVDKALTQPNDMVSVGGTLNNAGAGTVVVTNIGATAVVAGDKFQLFNKPLAGGGALTITGANIQWTNRLALDGSIIAGTAVPTVPTTPTNLSFRVSGGNLTISWPASYIGWNLESNSVSLANPSMWFTVAGSAATNEMVIPIDAVKTNVFFRSQYPKP